MRENRGEIELVAGQTRLDRKRGCDQHKKSARAEKITLISFFQTVYLNWVTKKYYNQPKKDGTWRSLKQFFY
jgi:hypothetical protein